MRAVSRKPVLALDLDGVTYEWEKTARKLLQIYFAYQIKESVNWNWIKDHIANNHWQWLWSEGVKKGLFRHGHVVAGAIEALRNIKEAYRIEIVTSRPEKAWQDTREWLAFHQIPAAGVHLLGPNSPKSQVRADVYVDDATTNIVELKANAPWGTVIVFDRPWNQDAVGDRRARGWGELETMLMEIANGGALLAG